MSLLDRFGRPLTRVRISVTDRCNLRCIYCHREGLHYESRYEATPEEIETLTRIFSGFGVRSVKITGGEPLLRADIVEIVRLVSQNERIRDVAITTNGVLLDKLVFDLKHAGLNRVNVNLPTTDPDTYRKITRGGCVDKVISGLMAAKQAGLNPIKINMLLLRGLNDSFVDEMIHFATENGFVLQLIELEPVGRASEPDFFNRYYVPLRDIKKELKKRAAKVEVRSFQKRTIYHLDGGGIVELVDPIENSSFCLHCMRIRVTPDLKLKPCLMRNDNLVSIQKPITEKTVKRAVIEANRRREPFSLVIGYDVCSPS